MPLQAGQGQHHIYRIASQKNPTDTEPLTQGKHYVEVMAVAWFINKQGNWFGKLMASGTLDMVLAGGLEKYQVALGTFDLRGDAKTAPVFNEPVLPERNYRGGYLSFNASLTAVKKNTVVAGMLKSAASASLGVVAGMVQTATLAGPAKILGAAGEDLIAGVKKILAESSQREPIFDFSGLKYSLEARELVGPELYILLHRGSELPEDRLSVNKSGQLEMPYIDGQVLEDGAWLLLKIRRSTEYHGVREWFDAARTLRAKVKSLVDDYQSEAISKEDALKRLKPSGTGSETLFDEFSRLRSIIYNDGVLSEAESALYASGILSAINQAKKSISQEKPAEFVLNLNKIGSSITSGQPSTLMIQHFDKEFDSVFAYRASSLPKKFQKKRAGMKSILGTGLDFKRTAKMAFAVPGKRTSLM